jgi:hypothetical protein
MKNDFFIIKGLLVLGRQKSIIKKYVKLGGFLAFLQCRGRLPRSKNKNK